MILKTPLVKELETCLSPGIYETDRHAGSTVVIIDILRATSAICAAFENGASAIIPVATVEEAKAYKQKGFLVAAERDGYVLDFADFGNSPFNFTEDRVRGKEIVYSTTNGTGLIEKASSASVIAVGSFLNISKLTSFLTESKTNVVLFCAGWKNRVNLEDTVCAGAIAERLLSSGKFTTVCDSTHAAIDLWSLAKKDPVAYIGKAAQRSRLRDKGLDDCINFCFTDDYTDIIPVFKKGKLVPLRAT